MRSPWLILGALTVARAVMAFQFQSVAALASQIAAETGLGFAAVGTLSGAYLLPGVIAALFGGWAGQRYGDFRIAIWGLVLMSAGGFAGALFAGFELLLCARLLAGIGAVALNVMLTKMAGDWFQGRDDLNVAMSLLVSSWPAGLALAAYALPLFAEEIGLAAAEIGSAFLCLFAVGLLALIWRAPSGSGYEPGQRGGLSHRELGLICVSGTIWGLYNLGFIAAITWTPALLIEANTNPAQAAAQASVVGWVAIFSVAAGGWLASVLKNSDLAVFGSLMCTAVCLVLIATGATGMPVLVALGLAMGPAAGLIMTLPIMATTSESRAMGMGVHWAIYYGAMGVGPSAFGLARDVSGSAVLPMLIAACLIVGCLPLWWLFRALQRRFAQF